jgi:type IV pilus assembly protein PilW
MQPSQRGFTLIELMIALVVGLIVSGAAVALVAAIGKSNSDTVRATRLTQELRATAEVIARDLRRARSDDDPIANVSTDSATMLATCNHIAVSGTAPSQCVKYGYGCGGANQTFNAVGLVSSKVYLKQSTAAAPACPTAADQVISSSAVNISTMTFQGVGTADANGDYGAYTISLAGQLSYQPSVTNSVTITNPTRTISQEVRIRSAEVQ